MKKKPLRWAQSFADEAEMDLLVDGVAVRRITWDKKKRDVKITRVDPRSMVREVRPGRGKGEEND
jgi:hypothetical protein